MEIKQYNQNHYNACIEIFKSNMPHYFAFEELCGLEKWLNGQNINQHAYKNSEAEYFYVLENNGEIVACGGFYIVRDLPIANMTWGMVHSSLHKKGFGKSLFEYRIQQIKAKYPSHNIVLDTTQHTYLFFEKSGFSVTEIRKDFYCKGLDRYDMRL